MKEDKEIKSFSIASVYSWDKTGYILKYLSIIIGSRKALSWTTFDPVSMILFSGSLVKIYK